MAQLFRKFLYGFQTQGLSYLLNAPRNELAHPRLTLTHRVRRGAVGLHDAIWPARVRFADRSAGNLTFVYDLGVAPVTFDFASYLAAAEVERRIRGLDGIVAVLVPGSHHGLRRELPEYELAVDVAARQWRVRNILLPMLSLLPSVRGCTICASRDEAKTLMPDDESRLYPEGYRVYLPRQPGKRVIHDHARCGAVIWPLLRAPEPALRFVADFLEGVAAGRRPIVISLRHSKVFAERNSRIADWLAFARTLDTRRYAPILVYDTEAALRRRSPELCGFASCEAASWNIEIRMALYQSAWLNMAIMHGPLELAMHNEHSRYMVFTPLETSPTTREALIHENGQPVGRNLDFARPGQCIAWTSDTLPAISGAFAAMEEELEALPDDRVVPLATPGSPR